MIIAVVSECKNNIYDKQQQEQTYKKGFLHTIHVSYS